MKNVSVVYAEPAQLRWLKIQVDDEATVADAIIRSGVLGLYPEIDLENQKVGIFGKVSKLDAMPEEGDRIEIYRPIIADPESVPRRDEQE